MKTFGTLIDEYIEQSFKKGEEVQSLYLYMSDYQTPQMVLQTSRQDWEFTEIIFTNLDLLEQKKNLKAEVAALQKKVKELEKSKKDVIKAIKLLKDENRIQEDGE